jgi:hypothetical protein
MNRTRREFEKAVKEAINSFAEKLWATVSAAPALDRTEEWMQSQGSALLRKLLGEAWTARAAQLEPSGPCECGAEFVFRQHRPQRVHTVLAGRDVEVSAPYYQCAKCRVGQTPLLRALGTDAEGFTRPLQELALRAGVIAPYAMAEEELLGRFAGVHVSREKVRAMVDENAEHAKATMTEHTTACTTPKASATLYVGIDGGMVHVDGEWQEVKLAVVYDGASRVQGSPARAVLGERDVIAIRGGPDLLRSALEKLCAQRQCERVVVLGDGAPWIWNLVEEIFANRVEILDWYHAAEHVAEAARALYGEGTERAHQWKDAQLERLHNDGVDDVIEGITFLQSRQRSKAKSEVLRKLAAYLTTNRHRMRYATFREAGHPIGSGMVESAVATVVQWRMKRPGMHWNARGADTMLALRSVLCSTNRWQAFCDRRARAAA